MKIGSVTLAYNDEGTIQGTIRCLEPFVETRLVLLSEKPYFGETAKPDATEDIVWDEGAEVIKGTWGLDHFQRNLGNKLLAHMDWILTFDSDEMMTYEDLEKLIKFLETTKEDAVLINPEVYWKDTNHRLRPLPTYCPPIAMRPKVRFPHIRNIDHPFTVWDEGDMHHLSWCAPKDIKKKVTCYAHATDFDGEKWYEERYKYWTPGDKVFLPDGEYSALEYPLPKELNEHLGCSTDTDKK